MRSESGEKGVNLTRKKPAMPWKDSMEMKWFSGRERVKWSFYLQEMLCLRRKVMILRKRLPGLSIKRQLELKGPQWMKGNIFVEVALVLFGKV